LDERGHKNFGFTTLLGDLVRGEFVSYDKHRLHWGIKDKILGIETHAIYSLGLSEVHSLTLPGFIIKFNCFAVTAHDYLPGITLKTS